jgi:membrane fusion protein, multidrug efflux system
MRKRLTSIVLLLALLAGTGLAAKYASGSRPPPKAPAAAPPSIPVVAGSVESHDVPIYLRGVGTVIAYNNVIVRSQITGQLTSIDFKQGQAVHKGDLLAQIDPRPYQAQLDRAIANRDRDQAHLVNARRDLTRYSGLAAKGAEPQQLADSQQARVTQLEAIIKSDEAVVENARVYLGYTRLTSPIDGVTGIRQIDIGNIIHPTDANGLVDVTQIQPVSVIFTLPEADFVGIEKQIAKGPLTVVADSQDGAELDQGTLELIDNQIIQTTGTIRLRATFPNAKRLLWPGELVNIRLLLDTRHQALTIDASAVQQGPNGPYVYLIGADRTVQMQPVTVAQIDGGQALINSGLAPNETVVVAGQYKLQPGSRITELHGKAAQQVQQSAVEQQIP